MGEPIWCYVKLRVPDTWGRTNPLIQGLSQALINGESCIDDKGLWTFSGEGNYGLYDDEVEHWLDWMRDYKVPFVASSEAKYEFEGETIVFNGDREWRGISGADQALLSHSEYLNIRAGISEFATVEEFFTVLNVSEPPHLLAHLPDKFPDDEEDE
jgi:hypothetical protein